MSFRRFCTCQQLIQLRRFAHVCTDRLCSFNMSVIDSAVFAHVCIDRLCPFNRSVIDSAVFAHYTACVYRYRIGSAHLLCLSSIPPFLRTIQLVYTACSLCKKLIYLPFLHTIQYVCHHSTIFAHHSICLSSVPLSGMIDRFCHTIQ